ncbi:MAG TPA: hypothetical protein VHY35_25130 [Stellaceae bacterium]|jgi:hypothetical protein|nr:hypothetical protein [Stellaceae bacterium]
MSLAGRALLLFGICVLVGLLLDRIGITAHGLVHDTWHTIVAVVTKFRNAIAWSLPYALLGAIVVVPVMLLRVVERKRKS